jgi:zinc protease
MKHAFYLLLLWFCAANVPLWSQAREIPFQKFTLNNGLRVILHEDQSTPIVAVSVMYHVGSKNESPDRTGFAHFFEHLLFEGSAHIGRGEFDRYVQEAGGTLNAYTSQDVTYYYEILPSNQLELGLWLESERMLHARVDQKGIDTQREVVKEEKRQNFDNRPYGTVVMAIAERLFQEHPYRWTPIGSMEHLDAANEEDYQSFYRQFYVPNNAVLSIAGAIDIAQTRRLVEKYFGAIPRGAQPIYRPQIQEPPLPGEIRDTIHDNIQLPAVVQAYRIPGVGQEDYHAVQMLSKLLSQGESSRLYKALVDEQQKALFVGSENLVLEDYGGSLAFGIVNIGVDPGALEQSIDAEIDKVRRELISERELQKLRNQMENEFVSANATMAGVAEKLAWYEIYYGDANAINQELDRYMQVSREDIRLAAEKYFNPARRVVIYVLPKPN